MLLASVVAGDTLGVTVCEKVSMSPHNVKQIGPALTEGRTSPTSAMPTFPATTIDDVVGVLLHDGAALSLDDMDAAVAAEAKRRAGQ